MGVIINSVERGGLAALRPLDRLFFLPTRPRNSSRVTSKRCQAAPIILGLDENRRLGSIGRPEANTKLSPTPRLFDDSRRVGGGLAIPLHAPQTLARVCRASPARRTRVRSVPLTLSFFF